MDKNIYLIPVAGVLALLFTYLNAQWVARQEIGTDRMKRISTYITDGAMAFLRAEYSKLFYFVVVVAVLLAITQGSQSSPLIALSFVVGAACSALAGYIGMKVATKANVRTANAARTGLNPALNVAFRGGSVMGMGVVGLGVLGLSLLYIFYSGQGWEIEKPSACLRASVLARPPSLSLRVWVVASTPKRLMWARIWWARWRRASRRIIR